MAFTLPSFTRFCRPVTIPNVQKYSRVRSQSFRDEGKSTNIVDANLSILRQRIEGLRNKESLNTCYGLENGWNYKSRYDDNYKKKGCLLQFIELAGVISSTIGLVFFSGSLCIFLVSFVVHMHG